MFKVLIVDDEIYVVGLIQKLIDWEAFGMCVIDIAHNGRRALQLVEEKKPDLVIVNAGMRYDDRPFLESVREFDQRVRLIVVSGLGQFEYARNAFRNDVEDYLLKPINKSELEESLSSVRKKLLSQRTEEKTRQELEQELMRSRRKLQEDLLRGMTTGTLRFTTEEAAEMNSQYFTGFMEPVYRLFSFHVEEYSLAEAEEPRNQLEAKLQNEIREFCAEMICYAQDKQIICLCNYNQSQKGLLDSYLKHKIHRKNAGNGRSHNQRITLCMGEEFNQLAETKVLFQRLCDCINSRIVIGTGRVIEVQDIRSDSETASKLLKSAECEFRNCLAEHDIDKLRWVIRELFSKAFTQSRTESFTYYTIYHQLLVTAFRYLADNGIVTMEFQDFEKDFYRNFVGAVNEKQIADSIFFGISNILMDSESEKLTEIPSMHIIKKYIAEHYSECIRLSTLAELANLDPVYFSRVFKKEEKIGFMEYLHQYRIDMSKKMLMNVRYNIDEVAKRSGFQDTRYFSRLFKRTVGLTPSEYRKKRILSCYSEKEEGCS